MAIRKYKTPKEIQLENDELSQQLEENIETIKAHYDIQKFKLLDDKGMPLDEQSKIKVKPG